MAGWLKRVDGSGLECFKTDQSFQKADNWLDLEPVSNSSLKEDQDRIDKLQSSFEKILFVFLQENLGPSCIRPLPPVLGDGQHVDLFKLYLTLRKKGGYERVSQKHLWVFVASECGFDSSVGLALKLVYFKYLHEFNIALQRAAKDKHFKIESKQSSSGRLMVLESDLGCFLSEMSDKENNNGGCTNMGMHDTPVDFICNGMLSDTGEHLHAKIECRNKNSRSVDNREAKRFTKTRNDSNGCSAVASHVIRGRTVGRGDTVPGSMVVEEDVCNRKRGRELFARMLKWINWVAKDPCDAAIGHIPESSRWKYYANDMPWKQVLLVREAMLLKKNVDSGDQQAPGQKKPKMHPFMYEDHTSSERLRYSQRLVSAKDTMKKSSTGNDEDDDMVDELSDSTAGSILDILARNRRRDQVPLGADHQAEVPEWTGETYESDTKWLGTKVWPLEKREQNNNLIEREPIGKGRQDSCGCEYPGSEECVKFHISEKRMRLKLEIGMAFYHWKFDKMGEEVAYSWSKEEEKEFHNIVKSNTSNHGKDFWDKLAKNFPSKNKQSLVSYYFNVFLLQQRGQQNRATPYELNSDEEDSGFQAEATNPGSIFSSPKKKAHL